MRITASDFHSYYRPSRCDLRIWLRARDEAEAAPSPYERVIHRLGRVHEQKHLSSFGAFVDLSKGDRSSRISATKQAVANRSSVIYQPALDATWEMDGISWELSGDPDFLLLDQRGWVIRDSKVSRRITEAAHPEILRQLDFYGLLFEKTFGYAPIRLEVLSGTGHIINLGIPSRDAMLKDLERLAEWKSAESDFYTPVGWTKCGRCPFRKRCWPAAVDANDVALVVGVDRNLVQKFRANGVETIEQLVKAFDVQSLQQFRYPWGNRTRRVGSPAESILRMAEALLSREEIVFNSPSIPWYSDYVMFDLEGIPAQLDELEKVFLWGLQVFGENHGEYIGSIAQAGHEGDKSGWLRFLEAADSIFTEHGEIPFVHWHHYERVRLDMYTDRFGDVDGIAKRVRRNLLDLLPVTQGSIALPLPSYSLKVVEEHIGFQRTLNEVSGDWAMATYIEATEVEDERKRQELLDRVLLYNREDLKATWAVLEWLRRKQSPP